MEIIELVSRRGFKYKGVHLGGSLYLVHPQFSLAALEREYERKVLKALEIQAARQAVIEKVSHRGQYMLSIGENHFAPLTVVHGQEEKILAILHYFQS